MTSATASHGGSSASQRVVDPVGLLHLAGEDDGADDGDHQEHRGDLEGEEVVGEERLAELLDVGLALVEAVRRPRDHLAGGLVDPGLGGPGAGGLEVGVGHGHDRQGEDGGGHDHGRDALAADRLHLQVLGPVDAEQHEDEQEQHDDGAGVDDHLHGGQEVGLLRHEQHGDAEQRGHQRQGGVDGVGAEHHAHRAGEADGAGHREHEQLDGHQW